MRQTEGKWVLIIDEIAGLNPKLLPDFLHTVRSLYHFRKEHALKSVIFVGVANLANIIADKASPFNIADSFQLPYFTHSEVYAFEAFIQLLLQKANGSSYLQLKLFTWYLLKAGRPCPKK